MGKVLVGLARNVNSEHPPSSRTARRDRSRRNEVELEDEDVCSSPAKMFEASHKTPQMTPSDGSRPNLRLVVQKYRIL